MKDIVINKRKLYITLGVILSAAVITMAPVSVMLLVNKANYDKQWNYYEKFTRITSKDLFFGKNWSDQNALSKWSMPANGSYYMEIDENTYKDASGNRQSFYSVMQKDMDQSLNVLNSLAIKFNQKDLPFVSSGTDGGYVYLTDQIKNFTVIFGEDLIYPYGVIVFKKADIYKTKTVLNIEDRTPAIGKDTFFSLLSKELKLSSTKINVSLTKTSGSRGHSREEWMSKFGITNESDFSLSEQ